MVPQTGTITITKWPHKLKGAPVRANLMLLNNILYWGSIARFPPYRTSPPHNPNPIPPNAPTRTSSNLRVLWLTNPRMPMSAVRLLRSTPRFSGPSHICHSYGCSSQHSHQQQCLYSKSKLTAAYLQRNLLPKKLLYIRQSFKTNSQLDRSSSLMLNE